LPIGRALRQRKGKFVYLDIVPGGAGAHDGGMGRTGPLSAEALRFRFAPSAAVLDGCGVVVGSSECDGRQLKVRDVTGSPVLYVGPCETRALRNDRYPVHDGRGVGVGWLGAWEGVVLDAKRIAQFRPQRLFTSSAQLIARGRGPRRVMATLDHVPQRGHRTAWFSDEWLVTFIDVVEDDRVRLLLAGAAYAWHIGRWEE
jgi:hypothetical protein